MKNINRFQTKSSIFEYLIDEFGSQSNVILVRGSRTKKSAKMLSDIDVGVYSSRKKKPYYEMALLHNKFLFITIYFYGYKAGEVINPPKDVEIIYGKYNKNLKPDFTKDTYNSKEKIRREGQLVTDFLFKYLRTYDRKYLKSVQKRI